MKVIRSIILCCTLLLLFCGNLSATAGNVSADNPDQENELGLTQAELDFLAEHPEIRLGVDPTYIPYEFFDSDGVYKGIAADYIALICQKTGLKMTVTEGLTWSEAYEKAVNRELDVLPCVSKTATREQYFLFSDPYFEFHRAIFINQDNNTVKSFDDLKSQKVAVQINSSHHGFLEEYDDIRLSPYRTVEEALLALSKGTESAFVGNLATSSYLIKMLGITNLKFVTIDFENKQFLYFAIRNDWPELAGIINKALSSVTEEEKIAIRNKWIGVEASHDYTGIIRFALILGAVIVIVLTVSVFWILRLRKEVRLRKRAQDALNLAKDEADRANQIKSMFLARMSHEIRTPLNAIMGMSYLLKKTDLNVTQGIYLDKLQQSGKNMLGIINDILDFSKIEAGKIEIERISFDLDKVLQRVINIESVKMDAQNVDFSMEKDPEIPQFYFGDPTRIEQVLLNLVSNAVKFTPNGSVTISVLISSRNNDTYIIEFRVKDTGIGMEKEQLDRLFIPFDQGNSSISRRFGGTGLGMSIVKNLTDLMGGEIEVSSIQGEGSTFCIRLPLDVDKSKEQTEIKKMAADCFSTIRALVLDPNTGSRNLLIDCFHSFGIRADCACSEEEVLPLVRKAALEERAPYNLVLADYNAPKEGGTEFVRALKATLLLEPETKFILIIPMSREALFEEAEAAGVDFVISKPIIPSVLYNGIIEIFKIIPPQMPQTAEGDDKTELPYPYHILIVEDNKTNQFIAQSILTQSGFRVSLADDGGAGHRFMQENGQDVDLILMDIHMPDMDGYTASDLIRKINPDVPIVAMTADAIAGVEEKCRSHGMGQYVSKPFDPDQLIETLLALLKTRKWSKARIPPTNPVADSGETVFDQEDGLKRIGGDMNLFRMILKEFYAENESVKESLKEKIDQKDFSGAVQIVHKIKSSSGNIGAKSLNTAAAALQKSLSDGDEPEIEKKHSVFDEQFDKLSLEITALLNP